jgi:hypothetical protein
MDTVIRRYRIRMEETMLVITHPTGISFDLTLDEALSLMDYITIYRQALIAMQRDTEPCLVRTTIDEADKGGYVTLIYSYQGSAEADSNSC